ncbi:uncharacterized protein CC84DRAFT_436246 [Paraphaeosphaeria sporulosa]|uniref:SMP domain-containing protein n=1 Tax=Paraphaeosphaeria sporulosa TaxID=1460663 RepID=A0A177CQ18_9PLEO|nr:uncharacterized protein CC84DRAFT_436246 [Paraphaeosphaeria sporulosa]OAG09406.1 hypothetical protein CC84DRAFT_436246 [Paraphaeosphaeria sporulosa]
MLSHTVLLALVAAVGAVPLNINLGAYSPALVVGDGEISLGAAGAAAGAAAQQAKRGNLVRDINEILKKREAAPEPTELAHIDAVSRAVEWIKRDINSFNAALGYAERAQQNQPKIELGTGAEGSGVGITVNAGLNVPANSAANGAAAPKAAGRAVKRSEEVVDEAEAPKMTLVAITEV